MNKPLKYIFCLAIVGIALHNSITIEELDLKKANATATKFNAKAFATNFMNNKIAGLTANDYSFFLEQVSTNFDDFSEASGKKLGISSDYYFLVRGEAIITAFEDENVILSLKDAPYKKIKLAIDFIFDNAAREATQIANIGDFKNTMDYNNISIELNEIIRKEIVPPFLEKAKVNTEINFLGAVKTGKNNATNNTMRIIPLQIVLKN